MNLREEAGLYLLGNFQLLRGAPFSFEPVGVLTTPGFQAAPYLVESSQPKRIPIYVLETGEDPTPRWLLRWKQKSDSTFAPFFVFGVDVFGEKENPAVAANQVVVRRVGLGSDESQVRAAIGRGYLDPSFARLKAVIHHQPESKLINIESQAAVLIAYEHDDVVYAQIRFTKVKAQD